jgi:hypothetical protein
MNSTEIETTPRTNQTNEECNPLLHPNTAVSTSPYHHQSTKLRSTYLRQKKREAQPLVEKAREISSHGAFFTFLWDIYSAVSVFVAMLLNYESVFGCLVTVGATLLAYYLVEDHDADWNGNLPTVLLSFAVITPLSASITMAFTRRETTLKSLASFRSASYNLYVAHASWDWGECNKGKGRRGCIENSDDMINVYGESSSNGINLDEKKAIDWTNHSDETLRQLINLSDSLCQYLTLPTSTRARHRVTTKGGQEAKTVLSAGRSLFTLNVSGRMIMISQLCEALKYRGLPGNEASRIRQWENFMTNAMEDLRVVKEYRTPQALRSFARLFTIFLPPFYAPSYVQVARDSDSLALGICLGIVTSIALTGLFECVRQLEDPFVSHVTLDGVDVKEELCVLMYQELMLARKVLYPEAEDFMLKKNTCDICMGRNIAGDDQSVEEENREKARKESSGSITVDRTSRHFCEDSMKL